MSDCRVANIVRLSRVKDLEPLDCQILASTTSLIVASELSDSLDLDGLCLIPTNTVRSFDRNFDRVHFYNEAVGEVQLPAATIELQAMLGPDLLGALGVLSELGLTVAVHLECDDPEVCFVGSIDGLVADQFLLHQISSWADPLDEPMRVEVGKITKLEIATRYLNAISRALRSKKHRNKEDRNKGTNKGDGSL
jgi:hypothetical protein